MNEPTTITVELTQNEHAAPQALAGIWLKEPEQVLSLAPRQLAEATLLGEHGRTMTEKALTSMTPVQKQLRLLEARRLLMTDAANVEAAAFQVGYESPSQFSRATVPSPPWAACRQFSSDPDWSCVLAPIHTASGTQSTHGNDA